MKFNLILQFSNSALFFLPETKKHFWVLEEAPKVPAKRMGSSLGLAGCTKGSCPPWLVEHRSAEMSASPDAGHQIPPWDPWGPLAPDPSMGSLGVFQLHQGLLLLPLQLPPVNQAPADPEAIPARSRQRQKSPEGDSGLCGLAWQSQGLGSWLEGAHFCRMGTFPHPLVICLWDN